MKRYAFIDASNTMGVAKEILGFGIDWSKLIQYLKYEKWGCEEVYFYKGSRLIRNDQKRMKKLESMGYVVRTKVTYVHQHKVRPVELICGICHQPVKGTVTIEGQRKSNCDVELTIDAFELAGADKEFLLFTGDGDFAYLIEKVIDRGTMVRIVPNTGRDKNGDKSFSTRLRDIIIREQNPLTGKKRVSFIDINDWKMKISK